MGTCWRTFLEKVIEMLKMNDNGKVLTFFMDGHFPNITDPNNRNFELKVQSFYCWIFRSLNMPQD